MTLALLIYDLDWSFIEILNPVIIGGILLAGLFLSFKNPFSPLGIYAPARTVVPPKVPKPGIAFVFAVGFVSYASI